jgi:chaperonin GroEL (HSP60 family)
VSHTHLLVQSAAREKVLHRAPALADAVRVTLGPKSDVPEPKAEPALRGEEV